MKIKNPRKSRVFFVGHHTPDRLKPLTDKGFIISFTVLRCDKLT